MIIHPDNHIANAQAKAFRRASFLRLVMLNPDSTGVLPMCINPLGKATFWTMTPINPRCTRPWRMSSVAMKLAVLEGMAKQIPWAGKITAVLTPITSPKLFTGVRRNFLD